ncbi:SCO6745 family protein [Mycolicibacterium sp. 22603]|uniref:SCO6745 family protein n=1 Tax=Mycolicibacterium sp. 22603 TaxID=3453950 RepID=UPI003F824870
MSRSTTVARRLFDRLEPIHAVTYFAPEARSALDGLGFRGFWSGYFAARSAPLGPASPEVVTAVFYNFAAHRVAKALPAAWEIAAPDTVLAARESAAVAALSRYGLADEVDTAAQLLGAAAGDAALGGRVLFAANRALPWPEKPLARLWHATTLLREHRGDGHVAALQALGISGRESNVLHAAAGRVPAEMIKRSRDYDDALWQEQVDRLAGRGLLDGAGELTTAGRDLKAEIEDTTDRLALAAFDVLSDSDLGTLFRTLTPLTRLVVDGGDVPSATPMGLDRADLDNDDL